MIELDRAVPRSCRSLALRSGGPWALEYMSAAARTVPDFQRNRLRAQRKLPGYHERELEGQWAGFRSIAAYQRR